MAMMASGTTGNPYDNYDNREIEQDLIDPDDGEYCSTTICPSLQLI